MALEIILPSGIVAVYGDGVTATSTQTATPQGLILEPTYRYGTIYNIWDGGAAFVYGGDIVSWKDGEQECRVVTADNTTYTLLKYNNLTKETTVIPPP